MGGRPRFNFIGTQGAIILDRMYYYMICMCVEKEEEHVYV